MSEATIAEEPMEKPCGLGFLPCRLCLHEYPNKDLHEIFARGSGWKKQITRAVGIKPQRSDFTTRMCTSCRMMIELIISFQDICQLTERLMAKGHTLAGDRWKQASGLIDSLWCLIDQHRETVREADNPAKTTVIETGREIYEITVPEELSFEFFDEIKEEEEDDADDSKMMEHIGAEETEGKENEKDNGYELGSTEDGVELDEGREETDGVELDEGKEEENPKKKLVRRKLSDAERKLKSEKVMCDTCGELISKVCLEGHLNRHLGVKPFVCEIEGCGRRLYSKYSLQQHRHLHKSIMRYYDCPDCGKRIKGTNCWMRHRKLHTEDPKHECNVCGKKFRRKFGLKLHSVVHTGKALFPCEICGRRFTVKHNLGAHYKTHMRNGTLPAELGVQ